MDVFKFEEIEIDHEQSKATNSHHALNNLENEFSKILLEIEENPATSKYVNDYYKLFENFQESNKLRKLLARKCAELEKQVAIRKQQLLTSARPVVDNEAYAEEEETIELIDNIMKQVKSNEVVFENKIVNCDKEILME